MAYTTVNKSSSFMNTKLYIGNGSTNNITGVGFQPDMTWLKMRSNTDNHTLFDVVRGVTKRIFPNLTQAEGTEATSLTAFNTDGFTLGADGLANGNTEDFVSWNWKANGAGSANTDGTINSTVSANTTSGFSIATWTGTGSNGSVGHGLGGVDCMIIKDLSNARDFYFWQKTMAYNTRLELNNTEAFTTGTDNMTALPDATKINMAVSTQNNGSGNNYVGYFFQEKQGYSKFGSYTGNGNANGPFIYTGFKPSFILAKRTDATAGWVLFDNKRIGYNGSGNYWLDAQNAEADQTDATGMFDQLSNGFKVRSSFGSRNASGGNYIYMAFAENPIVATSGTSAIPVTAR